MQLRSVQCFSVKPRALLKTVWRRFRGVLPFAPPGPLYLNSRAPPAPSTGNRRNPVSPGLHLVPKPCGKNVSFLYLSNSMITASPLLPMLAGTSIRVRDFHPDRLAGSGPPPLTEHGCCPWVQCPPFCASVSSLAASGNPTPSLSSKPPFFRDCLASLPLLAGPGSQKARPLLSSLGAENHHQSVALSFECGGQ